MVSDILVWNYNTNSVVIRSIDLPISIMEQKIKTYTSTETRLSNLLIPYLLSGEIAFENPLLHRHP